MGFPEDLGLSRAVRIERTAGASQALCGPQATTGCSPVTVVVAHKPQFATAVRSRGVVQRRKRPYDARGFRRRRSSSDQDPI